MTRSAQKIVKKPQSLPKKPIQYEDFDEKPVKGSKFALPIKYENFDETPVKGSKFEIKEEEKMGVQGKGIGNFGKKPNFNNKNFRK